MKNNNVTPQVRRVRTKARAEANNDYWKRAADKDARELIALIGIDGYREFIQKESGITDTSTWRELSLAICNKVGRVKNSIPGYFEVSKSKRR